MASVGNVDLSDKNSIKKTVSDKEKRVRISVEEKLDAADLTVENFKFYCAQFVENRLAYIYRDFDDEDWAFSNFTLQNYQIADHLAETRLYGVTGGASTSLFIIDIDRKKITAEEHLERVQRVLEVFPTSTIIRSSDSITGGIHLYNFLLEEVPTRRVYQLVVDRLEQHGFSVEPGYIEVYPKYRCGIRLPFGKGNYILDPRTFKRMTSSKQEDIWFIEHESVRSFINDIFE